MKARQAALCALHFVSFAFSSFLYAKPGRQITYLQVALAFTQAAPLQSHGDRTVGFLG